MSTGFRCGFRDHVLGRDPYQVAIWYPTTEGEEAPVKYRGYPGSAVRKSPVAVGTHPLILISHGTLGHRFCHCWLAEILARSGYIVAALQHPDDNVIDSGLARTPAAMAARPVHVSETLDGLLQHPELSGHIDPDRLALIGHSAGGATCLMLLGAEPDLSKLYHYCRANESDVRTCEKLSLGTEPPVLPDSYDQRFKAAFIMMSAYGPAFAAEDLDMVDGRVHVISAPQDEVIPDGRNSQHLATILADRAELTVIEGAGHYSSMPLCTELLARDYPELCVDGGKERADIHSIIAEKALKFFAFLQH